MASLRDLGLSEYEARAYRALLNTGPATAKELSRASDVPMGRIYDVLNSLEQYNLVRSQTASRPKKYVAVESSTALDRLLEDKKRELEAQAEQYEEITQELAAELDAAEPVEEQFWTAAIGADDAVDLIVERLAAAENRLVIVASARSSLFDVSEIGLLVSNEIESALDRDVSVEVLLSPELVDSFPAEVGERHQSTLSEYPDYEVRTAPNVTGTFNLIDDAEVTIHVPHPLEPDEPFGVIDLKDPDFAANVRNLYEPRWEAAEELSF
jgi:sugar-specific transcriptional regulator TrmB